MHININSIIFTVGKVSAVLLLFFFFFNYTCSKPINIKYVSSYLPGAEKSKCRHLTV